MTGDELIEELRVMCSRTCDDAIAEIERLRAEVAALTKDAERYRWLRDAERGDWFWSIYEDDGHGGLQLKSGADLDAALAAKEGT